MLSYVNGLRRFVEVTLGSQSYYASQKTGKRMDERGNSERLTRRSTLESFRLDRTIRSQEWNREW